MLNLSAVIAGALAALMSMPASINLLAVVGGELLISVTPLTLTLGFVLGVKTIASQFGRSKQLLGCVDRYLLAFLILATLSVLWSGFPQITLYRLYRLYALFLICFYFSMVAWTPQKFSKALQPALLFLTLGSIVYYLLSPVGAVEVSVYNGIVQPELVGAWKGITLHKNTLGSVASVAAVIAIHALTTRTGSRIVGFVSLLCASVCLVESRSSTSIFAALFATALMLLMLKSPSASSRRPIRMLSFTLAFFFLIYSLGVLNVVPGLSAIIEPIVAMTGKDMTFSGRTTIWAILNDEIARRPILGAGYAAYWLTPDPMSPSNIFKYRMFIDPGEAHNGYLSVINELGIVGMLALIGYLFTFLRQSMRLMPFDRNKSALFIALLFAEFIANLSEAHWWNLANVNFYIMTLASFDLGRAMLEVKRARTAGQLAFPRNPVSRRPPVPASQVPPAIPNRLTEN